MSSSHAPPITPSLESISDVAIKIWVFPFGTACSDGQYYFIEIFRALVPRLKKTNPNKGNISGITEAPILKYQIRRLKMKQKGKRKKYRKEYRKSSISIKFSAGVISVHIESWSHKVCFGNVALGAFSLCQQMIRIVQCTLQPPPNNLRRAKETIDCVSHIPSTLRNIQCAPSSKRKMNR